MTELKFRKDDWEKAEKLAARTGPEANALLRMAAYRYDSDAYRVLWDAFASPLLERPERFTDISQFYTKKLSGIVRTLTDEEYERRMPRLLAIEAEGRYSSSLLCRSFRSRHLSAHLRAFLRLLTGYVRMYYCENGLFEAMSAEAIDLSPHLCLAHLLALRIRDGDRETIDGIREAFSGDNSGVRLSRLMIEGIIRSGDGELIDGLLALLKNAGLQEGLRQQILEAADCGGKDAFARIVGFCAANDLFRFSSAVRALSVWTGFALENTRPGTAKRLGSVACEVLTSEVKRKEYLASSDLSDVWMALWGYGCGDLGDTVSLVERFIAGEDRSRKLLAWYFVRNSDAPAYAMRMACDHLDERDPEILAWVTSCLAVTGEYRQSYYSRRPLKAIRNNALPSKLSDRRELFDKLERLLPVIGDKKRTFTGSPFHYVSVTLSPDPVVGCLISLAGYDMDAELIRKLSVLTPYMSADWKRALITSFLHPKTVRADRETMIALLGDRNPDVRERAVKALSDLALTEAELDSVAASLKSRSSSYRSAATATLRSQPEKALKPLLHRMLSSREEFEIQAAADLIAELDGRRPGSADEYRPELRALREKGLSAQTEILLKKLVSDEDSGEYARENGFGLYDPASVESFLDSLRSGYPPAVLDEKELGAIFPSEQEYFALLDRVAAVFLAHADYEYEVEYYDGSRRKLLFSSTSSLLPAGCGAKSLSDPVARFGMLPFSDEFLEAFGSYARDPVKMTGLFAVNHGGLWYPGMQNVAGWFAELFKKTPVPEYRRDICAHGADFTVRQIISLLPKELDPHAVFEFAFYIYRGIVEKIGFDNLKRSYSSEPNGHASAWSYNDGHAWNIMTVNRRELAIWRDLIRKLDLVDEDFTRWFGYEYPLEMSVGVDPESGLSAEDIFRAHALKLLPREALYARFLREETAIPRMLSSLTRGGPSNERSSIAKLYEDYPEAGEIVRTMVERIVGIEEKRGELKTEVTYHAMAVERLYGSGHFVNLLAALGKENFFRGYDFSSGTEKRTVLSLLLKRCRPSGDDTPELLAERINRLNISEKRLAEAVMYCPQWAGLAEMAIGWDGLKSAVWFFHAHVNENYSAEKETEVALFSPITPEHFVDGAFDRDWFLNVHSRLGEQRFMTLYRSAKYINSGSNNHRRSQLYADAVLGKLDIGELEKEISDKRNQEKLRCYPLIPFAEGDGREALRRYEFIQKFAKESKQFGAQRRESEKKAVAIALENLAVATGLMDVNRLTWQMETRKTEELKPLMVPRAVGDVSVRLGIDEEGNASVICEKNGKILKTVPKQLAEDEGFLELKQSAKELKEQKRRSRESLERAMTERAEFGREELRALLSNPVLSPMIRRLVWQSDGELGFLSLSGEDPVLIDHNGEVRPCGEKFLIAHPHDMITSGVWHGFMRTLYDRSVVQPFKQVFREYYPVTEDEKAERTVSRRYAGYQVNPKRALALLKGRGWTVDYEEGLQRVFYGQDLVARLSALADWFSPADVEAPTLETVEFSTRRTGEPVALEDIPPILFSEVMRDIDLVVSVAYVGGVDPETSMSTIEIRRALAEELARLLKLENVRFTASHALIEGKLANWSVHLGSGIVHAEGKGMIPILPVHSQGRGRVFLPFADDDPRTAEILSKIILLSEDTKIRDPSILDRL